MSSFLLNIGQANVNSLTRKVPLVQDFLASHRLHILAITESHLLRSMPDSFISIPGYHVVRNDTPGTFPKHGVCLYIHSTVKFDLLTEPYQNVLTVRLTDLNLFVAVVYRPPSSSLEDTAHLHDFLLSFCGDKEVILLGDFNLPTLTWESSDPTSHASSFDRQCYEVFMSLGLTQWVIEPTFPRSGNILDLVLSTDADRVGSVQVLPPLPGCDHCPILCTYVFDFEPPPSQSAPAKYRKWQRGKYDILSRALHDIDWDAEFTGLDISGAYNRFVDVLQPLVEECVPLVPQHLSSRLPWKTNPPHRLRNRKKEAWAKYKSVRHRLGKSSVAAEAALRDFFMVNKQLRSFATDSQVSY